MLSSFFLCLAAGGVATNYANSASLHSDGMPNEPKYSHLTALYETIDQIADIVVNLPPQMDHSVSVEHYDNSSHSWQNGTQQQAWVYKNIAFIESTSTKTELIRWNNQEFNISPSSILIIDGGNLLYDTANVPAAPTQRVYDSVAVKFQWSAWQEPIVTPSSPNPDHLPVWSSSHPLEQLNLTVDATDYLYYSMTFNSANTQNDVTMSIDSTSANAFIVYIDGIPVGQVYDTTHTGTSVPVTQSLTIAHISAGNHTLTILSIALGIDNSMPTDDIPSKSYYKGIINRVLLGNQDLTANAWIQRAFMSGEWNRIYTTEGASKVNWDSNWPGYNKQPLVWYQADIDGITIPAQHELMFNATGLNRGHLFINGNDAGRYWLIRSGNNAPTQSLYHIPKDWVNTNSQNHIVLFEEAGLNDINEIQFQLVSVQPVVPTKQTPTTAINTYNKHHYIHSD